MIEMLLSEIYSTRHTISLSRPSYFITVSQSISFATFPREFISIP
jgi:hypothetical protein